MYQPMMSANNLVHMQQAAQQVTHQPVMSGNYLGQAMMLSPIPQNGININTSIPAGLNNAAPPTTSEEKEAPPHAFHSNNRSLYPRDTQYGRSAQPQASQKLHPTTHRDRGLVPYPNTRNQNNGTPDGHSAGILPKDYPINQAEDDSKPFKSITWNLPTRYGFIHFGKPMESESEKLKRCLSF